MRKKIVFATILVVGSVVVAALTSEVGFRLLYPDDGPAAATIVRLQRFLRGNSLNEFQSHPFLSYVHTPHQGINQLGFRFPDLPREKPPGVKRIACVGGSTTEWSAQSLAVTLEHLARERTEVLNFGMSGWTTAESLINFCLNVQDYDPDAVVIHHAVNDHLPRICPGFRADYAHWRTGYQPRISRLSRLLGRHSQLYLYILWRRGLQEFNVVDCYSQSLNGNTALTPDGHLRPETGYAYERNIRTLVHLCRTIGATPILVTMPHRTSQGEADDLWVETIVDHNHRMRRIATELDVALVDLHEQLRGQDDCFYDIVHFRDDCVWLKVLPIAHALWKADVVHPR